MTNMQKAILLPFLIWLPLFVIITVGVSKADECYQDFTAPTITATQDPFTFSADEMAFLSVVYQESDTEPTYYTREAGNPDIILPGMDGTVIIDLKPNTKYYYKLRARDLAGNVGESEVNYLITE